MLSVICFSKDRPLQLHAYIESLIYFSSIKQEFITVLYVESDTIKYDIVKETFHLVNWVKETSFYNDLLDTVKKAQNYILFGCDDVFFKGFFDVNAGIKELASNKNCFGFSLRMGLNLNYLPNIAINQDLISWNWAKTEHTNWNYPWDVSASVYKKSFVLDYLISDKSLTNPNRFEAYLADKIKQSKNNYLQELSAFTESKCLTLTVNRVQDEFPNEFDDTASSDLDTLYQAYLNGQRLDWYKFKQTDNKNIHVDASYFSLTKQHDYPEQELFLKNKNKNKNKNTINLKWKIYYWKFFVFFKETFRSSLPRTVLHSLRKLIK